MHQRSAVCPCGRPLLHYPNARSRAYIQWQVKQLGPTAVVTSADGAWRAPRHFLAQHPYQPWELKTLAARFGFARVRVPLLQARSRRRR